MSSRVFLSSTASRRTAEFTLLSLLAIELSPIHQQLQRSDFRFEVALGQKLRSFLRREIDSGFLRNDSCLVAHVEQTAHGFAAIGAVIEGALVDVHADEFVGELGVQVAGEL